MCIAPDMNFSKEFFEKPCRKYQPCIFVAPSIELPVHFVMSILKDFKPNY